MLLQGAAGACDFALDAANVAEECAGAGVEEEQVGGAFGVRGIALEAIGEELFLLIEETGGPEDVVDEVEFEGAADGIGGGLREKKGLLAELTIPGFGHLVAAGIGVVETAVAGGAGLAFGCAGSSGFLGVPAIGGELFVRNACECHWDSLYCLELRSEAVCWKARTASDSIWA